MDKSQQNEPDIRENEIIELDNELLSILLKDRSSGKNIIWATDNYVMRGDSYASQMPMTVKLISGRFGKVIRPRIDKSQKEQKHRVKDKAEVFTPSWICNLQNNAGDEEWFGQKNVFNVPNDKTWNTNNDKINFPEGKTWQDYVKSKRLEITCGEAPYLVSRYDTTTGQWIDVKNRIGILDRKLRVISENTEHEDDWVKWAYEAYKSTFGYEWQGDSLLIARENLLYSFTDHYIDKFEIPPIKEYLIEIAKIISWNIWQMDGLKNVIPNSCTKVQKAKIQLSLFEEENEPEIEECPACTKGNNFKHTGIYCKIRNWDTGRTITFNNIKGEKNMKFDFVVGNPPYQGENHQQLYTDFYLAGRCIANFVDMIFPIGWQEPKSANNLSKLNKPEIKYDKQIVYIDNRHNAFSNVQGAEWTNIVVWKKGYDNKLHGKQLILTEGRGPKYVKLICNKDEIEKPVEIDALAKLVEDTPGFDSLQKSTSVLKPYGLRTDVLEDYKKYNLEPLYTEKKGDNDIKIYCKSGIVRFVPCDYKFPKKPLCALNKFKVFVPYAWGNMSKNAGLGGAFSDIIIAKPFEACTETYLESGCFKTYETAKKHAKFLLTKFARACLFANKTSQHSTKAWGAVPIQDYHESWWDLSIDEINEKLFDKYNVPQYIRDYVNKNIQPRTEANIVNYKDGE